MMKNINIRISFIIPAYNAENTIERAIKSVLSISDHHEIEVIVVENGSTDHTTEVVEALRKQYDSIILMHSSEKGVSRARNNALNVARGIWIAFLDADDYFEDGAVERLLADAKETEVDLWCYGYKTGEKKILLTNKKNQAKYVGDDIELCRKEMVENPTRYMQVWAKLYKRSIIKAENLIFNERMTLSEDSDFTLRYTGYCRCICFSSHIVYHYTLNHFSTMRSIDGKKASYYAMAMELSFESIKSETSMIKKAFNKYILVHMNIAMVREVFVRGNSAGFRAKSDQMTQICQKKIFRDALLNISIRDCLSIRMLPSFFLKLHLNIVAAVLFSLRSVQNYIREKKGDKL